MPIQAPQWTEFLTCPVCCNEFDGNQRSPISLACSHTICQACLANLHKKQCPFDQTQIKTEVSGLPVNGALLQLVSGSGQAHSGSGDLPPCLSHLSQAEKDAYLRARTAIEQLALYLKPFSSVGGSGAVSRPMQRKLVTLVNCQLAEEEGRCRAMRAARSLGDRTVTELILYHQNPGHLSANLWAAVRARGCQFLGPAMQEEVLKLVLLALEDGTALSRKVLVMFVVQRLEPHFPQASKTSIGHVVQLLYRASCFKVSKREGDSSLMQLKEEFRSYEALRREHDAQIVQIATEAGLRIAPDQWSALLYGDSAHKSHMQSIMDKLQSPGSFGQSVQELVIALQRSGDPGSLANLRPHLEHLAAIDPNPEVCTYSLIEVAEGVEACRTVVAGLVEFMRSHGGGGTGGKGSPGEHGKYKVSLCRDLSLRGSCPRGPNCTFAHSDDELDKFRSKNRKAVRTSSGIKEDESHQHEEILYCSEGNPEYSTYPVPAQNAAYAATQHPTTFQQPVAPPFPPDMFNSPRHGNVMVRAPFPQAPPLPADSKPTTLWRRQPHFNNSKRVASSLAVLQHRKQELLNQLERVVARCNNNPVPQMKNGINKNCTTLMYQEVQTSGPGNFSVWNSGNVIASTPPHLEQPLINRHRPLLYRSDSGLTEEEFIPFDPPVVSKFGPISREGTKPQAFTEPPPQVAWLFNSPHGSYLGDIVQPVREGFIAVDVYRPNPQDIPPSDFLVESHQKMKLQLRTLEKKINDLKLATEGSAVLTEGEKLSQELQLIEQGIREREHQLRMCSQSQLGMGGAKPVWNGESWPSFRPEEEDSYEAGIANDIRELELRWEYELEEQEKRWSSEEETVKK